MVFPDTRIGRSTASGGGLVEADRPRFEALTGRVRPRPGRDAEAGGRGLHRLARWHGVPTAVEPVTTMVGEHDAVGIVGVALYAQMAEMV